MHSVLVVDDDPGVLGFLELAFKRAGYTVSTAFTGAAALESYGRDSTDLVVLDLNLPDQSGLQVLAQLRAMDPDAVVIMLTGQSDLQTAVEAMRAGAENFLPKPVTPQHLIASAAHAFETVELRRRARFLEQRIDAASAPTPAAESRRDVVREMADRIAVIAPADTTILLLGETGTGKSWLARRIHELSQRRAKAFVDINCAALSGTFLSSELFGHEKGAFTDARTLKRGLLEVADGGTLFLDEIGELPLDVQPKLLTVLETRRFRRMGGTRELETDVRLIAATNRDLKAEQAAGRFREDLFYRIAVLPLTLPPLRARDPREIIGLAHDFLHQLHHGASGTSRKTLHDDALQLLTRYDWPGNIRELRNVIERALILSHDSPEITPAHLPPEFRGGQLLERSPDADADVELSLEEVSRRHIHRVLEHCGGNRSRAARILGVSRVGLYKMLQRRDDDADDPDNAQNPPT